MLRYQRWHFKSSKQSNKRLKKSFKKPPSNNSCWRWKKLKVSISQPTLKGYTKPNLSLISRNLLKTAGFGLKCYGKTFPSHRKTSPCSQARKITTKSLILSSGTRIHKSTKKKQTNQEMSQKSRWQ
jgi:hypothetical protein